MIYPPATSKAEASFNAQMDALQSLRISIQGAIAEIQQYNKELGIKEHPILFSPMMVQAILNGTKTQTRRIIEDSFNGCWTGDGWGTGHPCPNDPVVIHPGEVIKAGDWLEEETPDLIAENTVVEAWFHCSTMDKTARCPYGKIGDWLWVRETCQILGHWQKNGLTKSGKQAWKFIIHPDKKVRYAEDFEPSPKDRTQLGYYPRPSIHCPKWTSRIKLLITDIRVERLLSISEEDAAAEGVEVVSRPTVPFKIYRNYTPENREIFGRFDTQMSASDSYFSLWDKINGKDSHLVNPWVWAITFKVVNP